MEKSPDFRVDEIIEKMKELPSSTSRGSVLRELRSLKRRLDRHATQIQQLITNAPEESLLGLDVTAADVAQAPPRELRMALSLKWTLRTDRAQDCLSQGAKLANLRRGKMPHYGVVTMEPRPYMLAILCDGSGVVDVVYHLNLPKLREAVEELALVRSRWKGHRTLERLVDQGRLRDYDDLIEAAGATVTQVQHGCAAIGPTTPAPSTPKSHLADSGPAMAARS